VPEKPGRNDLCPCGSKKKYKKCHGVAEPALWQSPWLWGILATLLGLAALAYLAQGNGAGKGGGEALQAGAPMRQGKPWEYDAASNMHFDPSPGHQHWHQGPPPAGR
jgi:hypothetical protein